MRLITTLWALLAFAPTVLAQVWMPPVNVSQNPAYNRWGCVLIDADGRHYSYMQGTLDNNNTWRLYYRRQNHDGVWHAPVLVGNVPRCEESRIGRYADGTRFIVFQATSTSSPEWHYTEQTATGWTAPVVLTPDDGNADLCTNANRILDVDGDDTIHLLSQSNRNGVYNMRYYSKPRHGPIVDHGDVFDSADYQINGAVRATGSGANKRVHFLVAGGASVSQWRTYYRRWNNPGWGSLINLTPLVAASPSGSGAGNIVVLPSGRLVACLSANDAASPHEWEVFLLFSDNNGDSWHSPVNISQNPMISRAPSCAAGADGTVFVVWEDNSFTGGQMQAMARTYKDGVLGEKRLFAGERGFDADVAAYGNVASAVWHADGAGDWEIVSSEYRPDLAPTLTPTVTPTPSRTFTPRPTQTPTAELSPRAKTNYDLW